MEGRPSSIDYTTLNNILSTQPNQQALSSSNLFAPSPHHTTTNNPITTHTQTPEQGRDQPNPDPPQFSTTTIVIIAASAGAASSEQSPSIRYRECQRSHAASIGGHAVDGCGEFTPTGEHGTPEFLKCAACECHRSFHRRETEGRDNYNYSQQLIHNYNNNSNQYDENIVRNISTISNLRSSSQRRRRQAHRSTSGPVMMAFGGAGKRTAESSSGRGGGEAQFPRGVVGPDEMSVKKNEKRRYRTKLSKEQKERMEEVAEKMGWKIRKQDDEQAKQICDELGVKKQVFKLWMHINKQARKKKLTTS